jgi:Uma2 family endonuclease
MTLTLEQTNLQALQRWDATWQDYLNLRDNKTQDWQKIAFNQGWLWIAMGHEGPNHASFSDLITAIFFAWAFLHPEQNLQSYGRCLIENPETQSCAPDLVLYRGEAIPQWQEGEPRRIDLSRHRKPDLVGEIADTTLNLDLDEQKQLYTQLGIAEYWVIDVKGKQIFAFGLNAVGVYELLQESQVLTGLPIPLIAQTLERLGSETNTTSANWLMQQLQALQAQALQTQTSPEESSEQQSSEQ